METATAAAPGDDGRACRARDGVQDPDAPVELEAFDGLDDDPDVLDDPAELEDSDEPDDEDEPDPLDDPPSPDDPEVLVDVEAGFDEPDDEPEPEDFFELLSVR